MPIEDGMAFAALEIDKLRRALDELHDTRMLTTIETIAVSVTVCLSNGGRVLFCGNGGSAADAQHFAAELVGRQNYDRPPAAGIALTVDSSVLTAVGNDYRFDDVFARQVRALGRAGDTLFAISTSGRSANVLAALEAANELALTTVALTGREPGPMSIGDHVLSVPADEMAKIQELHLVSGHIIFALVERSIFPRLR